MEVNNGDLPINPCELDWSNGDVRGVQTGNRSGIEIGLTKREHFAALAMHGLLTADHEMVIATDTIARLAVEQADELLAALKPADVPAAPIA